MQFTKALQHTIGWKALNTILTFFINLILVRILGAEGSGDFFYSIALLSFFTLLISWSLEAGITYYGSKNVESIASITIFVLPWLVVQAFVSGMLIQYLPIHTHPQLSWLYVLSNLVIIYCSALYYARKWFIPVNLLVCIVNAVVLFMLLWTYHFGGQGFEKLTDLVNEKIKLPHKSNNDNGVLLGHLIYFSGFFIQAILLSIVFFIKTGFKREIILYQPALNRKIFIFSSIAFISNILFFLVTRIDYYFVQKYCSEIALSNYVQVSKMGQLLVLLPSMMAGVIFPFSSGIQDKNYLEQLQVLCRGIGLLFIPVSITVVLTGYWLFPWLFGNGFSMMYAAMILYLPGFYCLSLVTLLAAHLAGNALLSRNMIASAIALLAVITGDILLIPLWGIYAAAAVSSAAYFLCMVYLLLVYKNNIGSRPGLFFAWRRRDVQLILNRFKNSFF